MEPGLAARNAEVIIRVVLGEHDLGSAITPARGLEQVLDAILPELFEEIQPGSRNLMSCSDTPRCWPGKSALTARR